VAGHRLLLNKVIRSGRASLLLLLLLQVLLRIPAGSVGVWAGLWRVSASSLSEVLASTSTE